MRSGEGESRRVKDLDIGGGVGRLAVACILGGLAQHPGQKDHGGMSREYVRQQ
jgi:hypothetical protein